MPESALKRTIDFTSVGDSRKPSAHVNPGDYLLQAESVEIKPSTNGPWENVNWQFSLVGQPGAGVVYENTTLKDTGLFRLRDLLEAFGLTVSKSKKTGIDFAQFLGKRVGATLIDNEYEGKDAKGDPETKTNSKVAVFFPASRLPAPGVVNTMPAEVPANTAPLNGHAGTSIAETVNTAEAAVTDDAVEELTFVDEAI